jgi:hypothetical protein
MLMGSTHSVVWLRKSSSVKKPSFSCENCTIWRQSRPGKGIASFGGQKFERARQIWLAMDLAGLWGLAIDQIGAGTGGKLRQQRRCALPLLGDDFADRKALTGIIDGRSEQLGEVSVPCRRCTSTKASIAPHDH